MTAGVPVVANNDTGLPCIVDDGVTGFVVDVMNVEAYTEALLTLLRDPALRQRMGAEGQKQSITRFSQASIASQLFALYEDVLGREIPGSPPGDLSRLPVEAKSTVRIQ
jgi:glycosyltransferase involved in cell wall biosynthesis